MMLRKFYCLAAVVGALFLAGSASAVDYVWTGAALDGQWMTGGNWDQGVPPPANANNVIISGGVPLYNVTIGPADVATPGTVGNNHPPYNMIFGPEWGATLNIQGVLLYDWYMVPVQWNSAGPRSTINMSGSAFLAGEGIGLGASWWWNGGPYVDMNMYDSSYASINWMFWGGHLNLYGGTMDIAAGLTVDTADAVSDATRRIDITGGMLILPQTVNISGTPFSAVGVVSDWISRGILQAYEGTGGIVIDPVSNPGKILVTALPDVPEPSSMALLGLGSLACALFLRRRSVS
jgi:hypothetical protein